MGFLVADYFNSSLGAVLVDDVVDDELLLPPKIEELFSRSDPNDFPLPLNALNALLFDSSLLEVPLLPEPPTVAVEL